MKVSVNLEDTDVYNVLSSMIDHPNKEDYLKLLVPLICESHKAVDWFFRLHLGGKLPKILEEGTLCYVSIDALGYDVNKSMIKQSTYCNEKEQTVCRIKQFRGYHNYGTYTIVFTDFTASGEEHERTTAVEAEALEPIEEI